MLNKRVFFIVLLLIIAIGTISSVSADNLADDMLSNATYDEVGIGENVDELGEEISDENHDESCYDLLNLNENRDCEDFLEDSKVGTFTELQNKIDNAPEGSTISLGEDYYYNEDFGKDDILIKKSLTINGNGHKIDGLSKSRLLFVNGVNNVVLNNIVFQNGDVPYYGGNALCMVNVNYSEINNCSFIGNKAMEGGAAFLGGCNCVSFKNCSFDSNEAFSGAGAIMLECCNNCSIESCTFNNQFASHGAILIKYCSYSSFEDCSFYYNQASFGGAIYLYYSSYSSFEDCSFYYNQAHVGGGAILFYYSNYSSLEGCSFVENYANNYGGSIYLEYSESSFEGCSFVENYARGNGGAIDLYYSESSFEKCKFYYNSLYWGHGGSIYSTYSNISSDGCDFKYNSANMAGGDIYSKSCNVILLNSIFSNSSASGFGASLSFDNGTIEVNNCSFENCRSAGDSGGAIYSLNAKLNVSYSRFSNNWALIGGAICSLNTDLSIKNDTFYKNFAYYFGGSVYTIYGSVSVVGSVFSFSYAQYGGSMYVRSPSEIKGIINNSFLYSVAKVGPRIYLDSYGGDIPESGNIYEDIYYAIAAFQWNVDDHDYNEGSVQYYHYNYYDYSNVITYVLSNSNEYQNNLEYYVHLGDIFASERNFTKSYSDNCSSVNICDGRNPNNSTIFLNYDDYNNVSIIYDSVQFSDDFDHRFLNIHIYDIYGTEVNFLRVCPPEDPSRNDEVYYILYTVSNLTGLSDWWSRPIFDDEVDQEISRINKNTLLQELTPDTFSNNTIKGKFAFNFEDKRLNSSFGNIYGIKTSSFSRVSLINYTPSFIGQLPLAYDSRDYGYITPVKDQSIGGNCWAFAGIATLEACLKKVTGLTYDFSEESAKNLMAMSSIYGLNLNPNDGGYDTMFMGYLTSWLGPVSDVFDTYHPESALSVNLDSVYHIQDISFLPVRKNSLDNDEYKRAIMDYGAISVILKWSDRGYHAISLVGWDDNYNGSDALGNRANGAWIFKNSWGTSWGDDGFGYLSYDQKLSEQLNPRFHTYTFIFNEGDIGYQEIYQYDFAGLTDYIYAEKDCVYYKNKFISRADDKEYLSAFSTYFEKGTYFTFSIHINGKEVTSTDDNIPIVNEVCYSPAGYHTISLGYNLTLNGGDEFEIIIKLLNPNENCVPVCQADKLYRLSYPSNVSFVSYDGVNWVDIYDIDKKQEFRYGATKSNTCQVACIKAFTTTCRIGSNESEYHMSTPIGEITGNYYYFHLNVTPFTNVSLNKNITIYMSMDWMNSYDIYENFVQVHINDKIYYSKIKGGKAYLNVMFDEVGVYSFSAKIKSNYFSSNLVKFNFVVVNDSQIGSFSSLKNIIDFVDANSKIILDRDYYLDDDFENEYDDISINKNLIIDGRGHTINGCSKSGIFRIMSYCTVTLENINFINGYSIKGSIFSYGNLIIRNCNFTNNHATDRGGAVSSFGECIIANSIFSYNSAGVYGGAIWSVGTLVINNSDFINNDANEIGGAIYSEGNFTLEKSTFNSNNADFGGAIVSLGNIYSSGCIFKNNLAHKSGGTIYLMNSSESNFTNDIFESNHAKFGGAIDIEEESSANFINVKFDSNYANNDAGAIYLNKNCSSSIKDSNFISNEAIYGFGGAVIAFGDINVFNSKFVNNRADMSGGAIYLEGHCSIVNSGFDSNKATYGGAVFMYNCECDISKSTFNKNTASYGGAVYSEGLADLSIVGSDFTYNEAESFGGSVYSKNNLSITGSNFKSNQENTDIIYFRYYVDENNDTLGDLSLKGNKMETKNAPAIIYDGMGTPYKLPLYLVFSNVKTIKGNYVNICQIKDGEGNTFGVGDVNVTLIDQNDKSKVIDLKVKYNVTLGIFALDTSSLDYGVYKLTGGLSDAYSTNYSIKDGVLKVVRKSVLTTSGLTKVYGKSNKLTVTLKDGSGNIISNAYVSVKLNGKTTKIKTNSKGQISMTVNLAPKTYIATILYDGNDKYYSASATAKVIIKKATPKMTANKISFKAKTKTKKYTITLKNNLGKAMKKIKVILKVKGKTFKATTNKNGKATFKINNLNKKGTFKATVKYSGSKYYNAVSKKITIKIKK